MFDLPDGMSPADVRKHPAAALLRDCANHGTAALPSAAELDALRLAPSMRAWVADACRETAELFASGNHLPALQHADAATAAIIDALPDEQRDPHYLDPPREDLTGLSPAELAARVPRY